MGRRDKNRDRDTDNEYGNRRRDRGRYDDDDYEDDDYGYDPDDPFSSQSAYSVYDVDEEPESEREPEPEPVPVKSTPVVNSIPVVTSTPTPTISTSTSTPSAKTGGLGNLLANARAMTSKVTHTPSPTPPSPSVSNASTSNATSSTSGTMASGASGTKPTNAIPSSTSSTSATTTSSSATSAEPFGGIPKKNPLGSFFHGKKEAVKETVTESSKTPPEVHPESLAKSKEPTASSSASTSSTEEPSTEIIDSEPEDRTEYQIGGYGEDLPIPAFFSGKMKLGVAATLLVTLGGASLGAWTILKKPAETGVETPALDTQIASLGEDAKDAISKATEKVGKTIGDIENSANNAMNRVAQVPQKLTETINIPETTPTEEPQGTDVASDVMSPSTAASSPTDALVPTFDLAPVTDTDLQAVVPPADSLATNLETPEITALPDLASSSSSTDSTNSTLPDMTVGSSDFPSIADMTPSNGTNAATADTIATDSKDEANSENKDSAEVSVLPPPPTFAITEPESTESRDTATTDLAFTNGTSGATNSDTTASPFPAFDIPVPDAANHTTTTTAVQTSDTNTVDSTDTPHSSLTSDIPTLPNTAILASDTTSPAFGDHPATNQPGNGATGALATNTAPAFGLPSNSANAAPALGSVENTNTPILPDAPALSNTPSLLNASTPLKTPSLSDSTLSPPLSTPIAEKKDAVPAIGSVPNAPEALSVWEQPNGSSPPISTGTLAATTLPGTPQEVVPNTSTVPPAFPANTSTNTASPAVTNVPSTANSPNSNGRVGTGGSGWNTLNDLTEENPTPSNAMGGAGTTTTRSVPTASNTSSPTALSTNTVKDVTSSGARSNGNTNAHTSNGNTARATNVNPGITANSPTYTVQNRQTIFDIARTRLGSASRWTEIYALNKSQISDPFSTIPPGTKLVLPTR